MGNEETESGAARRKLPKIAATLPGATRCVAGSADDAARAYQKHAGGLIDRHRNAGNGDLGRTRPSRVTSKNVKPPSSPATK